MPTDDRLTTLDTLLLSQTDEDGMLLSEFDGFCAGVIVCPEMIPPSEWLPQVWASGRIPEFESEQALQNALDLIMQHYNDVAQSLIPPEFEYAPVLENDTSTDEVIWKMWVSGFERAMRLRMHAWEQVVESDDEEAASSVSMMLALHGITEGDSDLPDSTIADLQDKAPDLITDMVIALNRWTKRYHKPEAASREDGGLGRQSRSMARRSAGMSRALVGPVGSISDAVGRTRERLLGHLTPSTGVIANTGRGSSVQALPRANLNP